MSDLPDPSEEISAWLTSLRLGQYDVSFQTAGYWFLEDCRDLTDERLLELQVLPTGHRRRILRSLEALGLVLEGACEGTGEGQGSRKPVPQPRHIFRDKHRAGSLQHPQAAQPPSVSMVGHTLPAGAGLGFVEDEGGNSSSSSLSGFSRPPRPTPRDPSNIQNSSSSTTSTGESHSVSSLHSDWEMSSEVPSSWAADLPIGPGPGAAPQGSSSEDFQGEMVDNVIYEGTPSLAGPRGPRPTRSFKLRHRPVPEIPDQVLLPPQDWSVPTPLTTNAEHLPTSQAPTGAHGKQRPQLQRTLTPIHPYGETFLYNNPEHIQEGGSKDPSKKETMEKKKKKKQR